jgi:transposase-like protein
VVSPEKWPWRYPPTAAGIQVNYCRNPKCANFGVPPHNDSKRGSAARKPGGYGPGDCRVIASGKGQPNLLCHLCGESFPMQSNLAIAEELLRISAYLEPRVPTCPNEACELYRKSEPEHSGRHTKFGLNAHGTPRFKCGACRKVFTFGGRSTRRQRKTHPNIDIFVHLMNSMPLRRIIKVLGISPAILYDRIDFLHEQCQMFAGERERGLLDRDDLGKRYISTDRQKLIVNWSDRASRKNTILLSIASADQTTGYLYAANVNFDAKMDSEQVQTEMVRFGDQGLAKPFRRFARVWLPQDWDDAAVRAAANRRAKGESLSPPDKLLAAVEETYDAALAREDIEAGDVPSSMTRTPVKGMLLHEQSVMTAHIQFVTRLLRRAEKLRFFVDQESGIRAAIHVSVPGRVLNRTADAFYVKVLKEFTVDQKKGIVGAAKRRLRKVMKDAGVEEEEACLLMALDELKSPTLIGKWGDAWFRHPVADMREPQKMVSWLTNIDQPETDPEKRGDQLRHYARLHLKASLTAVDRFFMQVRRALTVAERGVVSASADRRMWYGKNAYNPAVLVKLVEIFRTYFNYCEVGEDGRTPAMRLDLAKGPISPEDIIYYRPPLPERRRAPANPHEPKLSPPGVWPANKFDGRNEEPLHVLRREGLDGLEPLA